MKLSMIKIHWLSIAFAAWLVLGLIIAFATYAICGSLWSLFYDSPEASPQYSLLQRVLFCVANCYSWPVTKLFRIMENPLFDVRARAFALEVADIKFGPSVIILYALFYTSCTWLGVKLWPTGKDKRGEN